MASSRSRRGRAAGTLSVYRDALPAAVLSEADKLGMALHVLAHRTDLYERTEAAVDVVVHLPAKRPFKEKVDAFFQERFLRGALSERRLSSPNRRPMLDRHAEEAETAFEEVLVERASMTAKRHALLIGPTIGSALMTSALIPMMGLPMWLATLSVAVPTMSMVTAKEMDRGMYIPLKSVHNHEAWALSAMASGRMRAAFRELCRAEEEVGREMASTSFYDEKLGVRALALREIEKAFLRAATEKSWLAKKIGYAQGRRVRRVAKKP